MTSGNVGLQRRYGWIPAFAGMTVWDVGMATWDDGTTAWDKETLR